MKKGKLIRLAGIFCLLGVLSGCIADLPVDAYAYVVNIGVEQGDTLPYRYVLVLNQEAGAGGEDTGSEGNKALTVMKSEGNTLLEAVQTLSLASPAQLNFERTSLIALSRELAQLGDFGGLEDMGFEKLKLRENARFIVTEGDMETVLQGLMSEADPSMNRLKTNVGYLQEQAGLVRDCTLREVLESLHGGVGDVMALYCGVNEGELVEDLVGGESYPYLGGKLLVEGELKTTLGGTAVFAGRKMAGVLSGQHTMLLNMARGEFTRGQLTFLWQEGQELTVYFYTAGQVTRQKSGSTVTFTIPLTGTLQKPMTLEGVTAEELEAFLEGCLAGEISRVYEKVSRTGADVFLLGRSLLMDFSSMEQWETFDVRKAVEGMEALFQVEVKMSRQPDGGVWE